MSENRNSNPQEIVKQLQAYKSDKLAALLQRISADKSKAAVLRASIKAKAADLAAVEEAQAIQEVKAEEPVPEVAEVPKVEQQIEQVAEESVTVEEALPEVKAEEVKETVSEEKPDEKAEPVSEPAAEVKPEIKAEEVKPAEEVKAKPAPANKIDEAAKPTEEKKAKPEKEEAKVFDEPTSDPNIWIRHNPDGTTRRVFIAAPAPAKKKPETTSAGQGGGWVVPTNTQRNQRGPRPQNGQGPTGAPRMGGPRPQGGGINAPANFPPSKAPAKGGKQPAKKGADPTKRFEDKSSNMRSLMRKGFITDQRVLTDDDTDPRWRSAKGKKNEQNFGNSIVIEHAVIETNPVSIKVLSEKIGKSATEIISTLFMLGIVKTINESIDFDTAELVTSSIDDSITLELRPEITHEEELKAKRVTDDESDADKLTARPPIVTIMGHVDHGKTSLLDYIRKSNVTGGEAGGITQHIGAYTVNLKGEPITFLDTPGHEAFTSMRARGAQVTDIAVLVVAADDGVMPQTIEAINHAKQAGVPIIVACNKIDKSGANPDQVLQQLTKYDVIPEVWGGETPVVNVSAKTGEGVSNLLETILTMAEMRELKANPDRTARGTIIEAKLDKSLGKVATVLVQTGTLKCGDSIIAGVSTGKVKIMKDDKGRTVKQAGPSTPVSVIGWENLPEAGDILDVVENDKFARDLADERTLKLNSNDGETAALSLNELYEKIQRGELKAVSLIIKADVQGSLEAVKQSLSRLGNEEVDIKIVHGGVGAINESDVSLAETAKAIIVGFNVRPDFNAKALAAQKKIDIRFYDIIYNAIEDIQKAVKGLLAPEFKEVVLGTAEVRNVFRITGVGNIAGCHVTDGKIVRGAKARLIRNGKVELTTEISSLKHEKDDAKEIAKNFDCGICLLNYQDIKVGDTIEAFQMEKVEK